MIAAGLAAYSRVTGHRSAVPMRPTLRSRPPQRDRPCLVEQGTEPHKLRVPIQEDRRSLLADGPASW